MERHSRGTEKEKVWVKFGLDEKILAESTAKPYDSPFKINQGFFLKQLGEPERVLSGDIAKLLSASPNTAILETNSQSELLRLTKDINNKNFYLLFSDNDSWRLLGVKAESKSGHFRLKLCISQKEFYVEIFHNDPSTKCSSRQSKTALLLEKVKAHSLQCNFRNMPSIQKSIEYMNEVIVDQQLDQLEESHRKPNPSADPYFLQELEELYAESQNQLVQTKRNQFEAHDLAFVMSSGKKMISQNSSKNASRIGTPLQPVASSKHKTMDTQDSDDEHLPIRRKRILFQESSSQKNGENRMASTLPLSTLHNSNGGPRTSSKLRVDGRRSREAATPNKDKEEDNISCPICYIPEDNTKEKGVLGCKHQFCFECITDWAKVTNCCPLCKREFMSINKHSPQGDLLEEVAVQPKAVDLDQLLQENDILVNADEHCYACELTHNQDDMLVCDHCLTKCCHIQCLNPPLEEVPHEPWYCDTCIEAFGIRTTLPTANLFNNPNRRQRNRRRQGADRDEEISANYSDFAEIEERLQREEQERNRTIRNNLRNERRQRANARHNELANISRSSSSNSMQDRNTLRFVYDHNYQHNQEVLNRRSQRLARRNRQQQQAPPEPEQPLERRGFLRFPRNSVLQRLIELSREERNASFEEEFVPRVRNNRRTSDENYF